MDYAPILKQLAVNALFWTGIAAIILTVLESDYYFALFFVGLVALNFALIMALKLLAPNAFKIETQQGGQLHFRIKPKAYPKVLDEDKKEFLPEFIRVDIIQGGKMLFTGDVGRNMLKQLRDSFDQALSVKEVKPTVTAPIVKQKRKGKK